MSTGSLSLYSNERFYTLLFAGHGWMAADMIQYLPDLYSDRDRETAILKLLGYTMEVSAEAPPRVADHWVEVLLEERVVETNSDLIRKAVRREAASDDDPFPDFALRRVHDALDHFDFTVRLAR